MSEQDGKNYYAVSVLVEGDMAGAVFIFSGLYLASSKEEALGRHLTEGVKCHPKQTLYSGSATVLVLPTHENRPSST